LNDEFAQIGQIEGSASILMMHGVNQQLVYSHLVVRLMARLVHGKSFCCLWLVLTDEDVRLESIGFGLACESDELKIVFHD
jgi:hypothetical protein